MNQEFKEGMHYHLFRCKFCDLTDKRQRKSGYYKVYKYNYKLYLVCPKCKHKYEFNLNE